MTYRGFPYFVTERAGASRHPNPYASERHTMPDRPYGVRHLAYPRSERSIAPYRLCDTVCPPQAHRTRAVAKPTLSDIEPRRVFVAIVFMVLIACASALLGFGVAQGLTEASHEATAEEGALGAAGSTKAAPISTSQTEWKRGTLPHLFLTDPQWAARPYGSSTISAAGAVPLSLAMVRVDLTGDKTIGPVEVASFAQQQGYASLSEATPLLTDGAAELGLTAQAIDADEQAIRSRVNAGHPVICAVDGALFGDQATFVVLNSIDQYGRLVIVDPASTDRTTRHWTFTDIISASTGLWSYTVAS